MKRDGGEKIGGCVNVSKATRKTQLVMMEAGLGRGPGRSFMLYS